MYTAIYIYDAVPLDFFGNLATLETIGQPKLGLLSSPLLFNGRKP